MLVPARPAAVVPDNVTTGTPIHSAWQLVVIPLYGSGSRQMSIRSYRRRYSGRFGTAHKFHPILADAR